MTVRVVIPTLEPQPPVAHVQGGNGSEHSDDYRSVVAVLNDQWRVVVCRVGIRWILQRRRGQIGDKPRWDGRNFCRSKAGLLEEISRRLNTDLKDVSSIGDALRDLQAAAAAGAQPVLVLTGKGEQTRRVGELPAGTRIYADLAAAAKSIIK